MDNLPFLVLGLALPILLWPIEYVLPLPHLVEEIAKLLGLILLGNNQLGLKPRKNKVTLKSTLIFALAFTVSESMLYMMNFFILGQLYLLPKRLLLTGLLHTATMLILFFGLNKNIIWKMLTLIMAICLHYVYNECLTSIF